MKATLNDGTLSPIPRCQIDVPNAGVITLRILPELTDTKSASYHDDAVIGRSFPIKKYSHSENRTITMKAHFITLKSDDVRTNMFSLRSLQSAVYPRESNANPYIPPPICRIRCGNILAGEGSDGWLCVVLKSYSVSYDTGVAWHTDDPTGEGTYLPYKFSVDLTWDVVYANEDLPGQDMILGDV